MNVFRIEVSTRPEHTPSGPSPAATALREAGLANVVSVATQQLFYLEGELDRAAAEDVAATLLADPVTEHYKLLKPGDQPEAPPSGGIGFEIHPRPGVMDPVAETTLAEARAEGVPLAGVRTGRRFVVIGKHPPEVVLAAAARVLANDCIETLTPGSAGVSAGPVPPQLPFELRHVPIRNLPEPELEALSRRGHLFLSLAEMRAIQEFYRLAGRDPTDLELETLAQTWSEHCVHKTLKSAVVYRGAPIPTGGRHVETSSIVELRYANLLKDTIVRATNELMSANRGPECLSVFKDNAGVIGFDADYGLAFKVETHNRPSAIEPYGGAATGVGGCIRDVMGCGLGARPIANTDVFCVAPSDWPQDGLPRGVLHPWRVLRGVVKGVADYGNRMGIPTVNGAIYFDPRYLGNPLVFCGCVGLIPRDKVSKAAERGDLILVVGGRTGRDGIHGATFSSAELTDSHADEFSHAVQIGNAITEKRVLDALMQARDAEGGCLYTAVTDCGAGGLSSAVGEMGAEVGATVDLETVPLKYPGLRYDEIWISEAQERMVLAVPPQNLQRLMRIMADEEVEATVIGRFGPPDGTRDDQPRLRVRYNNAVVGDLDMHFLHEGLPRGERQAEWSPTGAGLPQCAFQGEAALNALVDRLSEPTVRSKAWVIRQYDHEVQGGSVVKPLCGPGPGPADAAVLRPRLDVPRGIAVGCGLAPELFDVDPYWMAAASIDEAIRNVVCVGGDPRRTAVLDNFCWGRTDDPRQMGALVRACQACCDVALAYGTPFISGKDSLNNEFALDAGDIEPLAGRLREAAASDRFAATGLAGAIDSIIERIHRTGRLSIPGTLLISAVAIVQDVTSCVTSDLKQPGSSVYFVGGLDPIGFDLNQSLAVHHALADAISAGLVAACHDVSDGGWLTCATEMAIAGRHGFLLSDDAFGRDPMNKLVAAYIVEARDATCFERYLAARNVEVSRLGEVTTEPVLRALGRSIPTADLRAAWSA